MNHISNIKIINNFFRKIGLESESKTDPQLMSQLIKKAKLDNYVSSNSMMNKMLEDIRTKPQNLDHCIKMVRHGVKKNPGVVKFIELGLINDWFSNNNETKLFINMAYLLQFITFAQANNNLLALELMNHFHEQEKKYGMNSRNFFWDLYKRSKAHKNFFTAMKDLSVRPAYKIFCFERSNDGEGLTKENFKELKKNRKINFFEKSMMAPVYMNKKINYGLLQLNIFEASLTEFNNGFKDNALAGYTLMVGCAAKQERCRARTPSLPKSFEKNTDIERLIDQANYVPNEVLSQEWADLYTSWNAAFVLGEYEDLSYILPKLFIPSVVDAKPYEYMFNRVMTLYDTLKLMLFRAVDKLKPIPRPEKADEMARAWGKITKEQALEYVKNELKIEPEKFEKEFNTYFSRRYWNFISLLIKYIKFL